MTYRDPDLVQRKVEEWKGRKHVLLKVRGFIDSELRDLDHNIRVWESERGEDGNTVRDRVDPKRGNDRCCHRVSDDGRSIVDDGPGKPGGES